MLGMRNIWETLARRADLKRAAVAGLAALAAVTVVSAAGGAEASDLKHRLVAYAACGVFAVSGVVASRALASELATAVTRRGGPGAAGVVRLLTTIAGCLIVMTTLLGLLALPVQHLLVSGAITGVILGIAAQQSLGNVFAGLVLLVSRPFSVGEWIVVNSGSLGGSYQGRVRSIGLTFTTIDTDQGPLNFPNSALIAAATGPRQPPMPSSASTPAPDAARMPFTVTR